jgi:hypothetical protein
MAPHRPSLEHDILNLTTVTVEVLLMSIKRKSIITPRARDEATTATQVEVNSQREKLSRIPSIPRFEIIRKGGYETAMTRTLSLELMVHRMLCSASTKGINIAAKLRQAAYTEDVFRAASQHAVRPSLSCC